MIECINKVNNKCQLVYYEIGLKSVDINEATCQKCIEQSNPRSLNKITSGLCLLSLQINGKLNLRKHNYLLNYAGLANMYGVGSEIHFALIVLKNIYCKIFKVTLQDCDQCVSFSKHINAWPINKCWEYRRFILSEVKSNCDRLKLPFYPNIVTAIILYSILKVRLYNGYLSIFKKQ